MDQYTNAAKVYRNFIKFGFKRDGSQLKPSTRQTKKWMVEIVEVAFVFSQNDGYAAGRLTRTIS